MKCNKCKKDFEEEYMELSHDIPKYIGGIDLDGRCWLCKKCHEEYDNLILKKCLNSIGEEFIEEERSLLMSEIKKLPENIKKNFRKFAKEIREVYFNGRF